MASPLFYTMSDELIKQIDVAIASAFRGLPVEFHKIVGERIAHAIGVWINEKDLDDVLCDIRYARGSVEALILEDSHRSRYGGHVG